MVEACGNIHGRAESSRRRRKDRHRRCIREKTEREGWRGEREEGNKGRGGKAKDKWIDTCREGKGGNVIYYDNTLSLISRFPHKLITFKVLCARMGATDPQKKIIFI